MAAATTSHSPPASSDEAASRVPWDRVERFVGQLTHDIRNGLNAIELQLTFLGEISTDPEAIDEVKRLRGTLRDVTRQLQAVKLATAAVKPHVLEYPANDFFEDLRGRVERLDPERAAKVSWSVVLDATALLFVDPDLSINGLIELFANAFRFGSESLHCAVNGEPGHVTLVLEENPVAPPAITPERWGREPLFTSQRGAYGLGLFRTRSIIETQGGSLDAVYVPTENLLRTTVVLPRPNLPQP